MENTPEYIKKIYSSNLELWNIKDDSYFNRELIAKTTEISQKIRVSCSEKIDVSVVIPARNEEKYILMTLYSLAQQKTSRKFEIIVVVNNNSSSDITPKICEMCGVKLISYNFYSKKLNAISLARQVGLIHSKGKYIFSTDADTILMPNWIEILSNELDKDAKIGYVTSQSRLYFWEDDEKVKANDRGRVNIRKIVTNIGASGLGNNMAFRREYAEKRGGWNIKVYPSDDTEISLRLTILNKMKAVMLEDSNSTAWLSPRRVKEHGKHSFFLDFFTSYSNLKGERINVR